MLWHKIDRPEGHATLIVVPQVSSWVGADNEIVSSEEWVVSYRFRDETRRRFWLKTRVITRHILALYLGLSPKAVTIARSCSNCSATDHGKPYIPDHLEVQFNLSHSADTLVLAISEDRPVGVDIEYGEVTEEALKALGFISCPEEPPIDCWVRTEAALKAIGWGIGALDTAPEAKRRLYAATQSVVLLGLLNVPIGLAWARSMAAIPPPIARAVTRSII